MNIPFIDLSSQRERIKNQIDSAIKSVLDHGQFIMGPEVRELEEQLEQFVSSSHCVSCSNGTDALSLALMAYDVGPGDAVITTPFTFFGTVEAIMLRGAVPVFADIDPDTLNICPEQINKAIERIKGQSSLRLRGIVTVDLFGLPADYRRIDEIAGHHELFILQDAAQAFGGVYNNRRAPSHGHVGTTSFFPAKPLGCFGDGGAVFTDNDEIATRLRSLRVHGKGEHKYDNVQVGLNARLDTIQAAILLEKLKIYPQELEVRQQVASRYTSLFDQLNDDIQKTQIVMQKLPAGSLSAWAQFVILHPDRDKIMTSLKNAGIPTVIYYNTPVNKLKACNDLPLNIEMSVAESASRSILALPFHPYLHSTTQEEIVSNIRNCLR